MPNEDLNRDEEVSEDTNPSNESESDASELDGDQDENVEEMSADEKVVALEKQVKDLQKGVSKFFSEKGREKKTLSADKETSKVEDTDDVTELFLAQTPQAELVQKDLKNIADKMYDGSILKAWKHEKWIQDKATALQEDEANKAKIDKPSSGTVSSKKVDLKKVKPEEVSDLPRSKKVEWLKMQAEKERNSGD